MVFDVVLLDEQVLHVCVDLLRCNDIVHGISQVKEERLIPRIEDGQCPVRFQALIHRRGVGTVPFLLFPFHHKEYRLDRNRSY